jgi:hypothetical protein
LFILTEHFSPSSFPSSFPATAPSPQRWTFYPKLKLSLAKREKDEAIGTEAEAYKTRYLDGFSGVIILMQQQSEIFDVPLTEILTEPIDEKDLL